MNYDSILLQQKGFNFVDIRFFCNCKRQVFASVSVVFVTFVICYLLHVMVYLRRYLQFFVNIITSIFNNITRLMPFKIAKQHLDVCFLMFCMRVFVFVITQMLHGKFWEEISMLLRSYNIYIWTKYQDQLFAETRTI